MVWWCCSQVLYLYDNYLERVEGLQACSHLTHLHLQVLRHGPWGVRASRPASQQGPTKTEREGARGMRETLTPLPARLVVVVWWWCAQDNQLRSLQDSSLPLARLQKL